VAKEIAADEQSFLETTGRDGAALALRHLATMFS
jgi:hypothetical protein